MSFHVLLRKLKSQSKSLCPFVFDAPYEQYSVKANCHFHAPYPRGICSKCAPSAITLRLQDFRHVDHVEFGEAAQVESAVIGEWRRSGRQGFAWMWGRWEPATSEGTGGVPLGIKAVVEALEVPPQQNSADGFEVGQPSAEYTTALHALTGRLGLFKVPPSAFGVGWDAVHGLEG